MKTECPIQKAAYQRAYRPKMGDSLAFLDTILARIKAEDEIKPQLELVMA